MDDDRRYDDVTEEERQLNEFCRSNCGHSESFGCDMGDYCAGRLTAWVYGEPEPDIDM